MQNWQNSGRFFPRSQLAWMTSENSQWMLPLDNPRVDYTLICGTASYAITGASATLKVTRVLNAAPGAYALTGASATLSRGLKLNASPGSYVLTGVSATLAHHRRLNAAPGSYEIVGHVAVFTLTSEAPHANVSGYLTQALAEGSVSCASANGTTSQVLTDSTISSSTAVGIVTEAEIGAKIT